MSQMSEYTEFVRSKIGDSSLAHAAMGLCGEAGEVCDLLKKHLYFNRPIDITALSKELGDTLFYLTFITDSVGLTLSQVMGANVEKLNQRYPNGYSDERANNRVDEL